MLTLYKIQSCCLIIIIGLALPNQQASPISDFSCRTFNWKKIVCKWNTTDTDDTLLWSPLISRAPWYRCPTPTNTSCEWDIIDDGIDIERRYSIRLNRRGITKDFIIQWSQFDMVHSRKCIFSICIECLFTVIAAEWSGVGDSFNVGVKNLSCYTYNWEEYVQCTWDYNTTDAKRTVNVKWQEILYPGWDHEDWLDCPDFDDKLRSCRWEIPDDIDMATYLSVCINGKYCNLTDLETVVQPAPVQIVSTNVITSTSASIIWSHYPVTYNKTFEISVMETSNQSYQSTIDYIYMPLGRLPKCSNTKRPVVNCSRDTVTIKLTELLPYKNYTITVRNKPLFNGFWSRIGKTTLTTLKDVPSLPPKILTGSIFLLGKRSERAITVYWEPPPKYVWNGDRLQFEVDYRLNMSDLRKTVGNVFSETFPVRDSGLINITIWSRNEVGMSVRSSEILINDTESVADVVLSEIQENRFELTWSSNLQGYIDTTFFYWCDHQFGLVCKTVPKRLEVNSTHQEILIPEIDPSKSYLIGLSQTAGGINYPLFWTDCLFTSKRWNLPMDISIKTLPESAKVKLDWFPIRCNIPLVGKLLILYQLKLCNDHDCTTYNLRELSGSTTSLQLPLQTICVSVRPITRFGFGSWSPIRCLLHTHPIKRDTIKVLYIVCGICGIILCIALTIIMKKKCKQFKRDLEIDPPVICQLSETRNNIVQADDIQQPLIVPRDPVNKHVYHATTLQPNQHVLHHPEHVDDKKCSIKMARSSITESLSTNENKVTTLHSDLDYV